MALKRNPAMSLPLQLPALQNWSCHNCGGCCRQHQIEITPDERDRILAQDWTANEGVPEGDKAIERMGPFPWSRRWRLGHRPDGACVFLDDRGLCRIHARFGETAKPLACRVYPYAFHPAGRKIAVSLRYSCPSVVANKGRTLAAQQADLVELQRLVVPAGAEKITPPRVTGRQVLDWDDTLKIVNALDRVLAPPHLPVVLKLLRGLALMDLVKQSSFEQVRGGRLREFLEIISQAVEGEWTRIPETPQPLSPMALRLFRMLVAQYARRDSFRADQRGLVYRWQLLKSIVRFTRGVGDLPPLQEGFRPVPFADIEEPAGLPSGADALLTRFLRVKIQGLHFCGRAYYGLSIVDGFVALVLAVVSQFYLARWLARGEGRSQIGIDDLSRAMTVVDHHHGYSPALGLGTFRARQNLLMRQGDVSRLLLWYAQ